jgi:hypothetical protein
MKKSIVGAALAAQFLAVQFMVGAMDMEPACEQGRSVAAVQDDELQRRVAAGDHLAMFELAGHYSGINTDYYNYLAFLLKKGHMQRLRDLGFIPPFPDAVVKRAEAYDLYLTADRQGHELALATLANTLVRGALCAHSDEEQQVPIRYAVNLLKAGIGKTDVTSKSGRNIREAYVKALKVLARIGSADSRPEREAEIARLSAELDASR